ncbi:FAD-dependent oxidoreductase [Exilibacterium tricleocarpae]|uniref:FAD-dependent oxidoreductase n=1 Tax=Exilibacterium tricleocarpae TaxID=2591008 RepID=UPI0015D3F7F8|nr:FAD-dependent oxidoreductase [Exilibacterium tricleocarpae]
MDNPIDSMINDTRALTAELAIVGAGPAGLAAAEVAVAQGIDVVVVDEQLRPGGQIYRQPPPAFQVKNWLTSSIYKTVRQLLARVAETNRIRWLSQTTVLAVLPARTTPAARGHKLILKDADGSFHLDADCVLIASGCYDMPVVFPGANLPGVMATGGIQAFVKSQQLVPGERFLFAGSHPLQLIVADQTVRAGGQVAGVIFSQPASTVFLLLKSAPLLIRHGAKLAYFTAALVRLLIKGVPIRFSRTVKEAHGDQRLQRVDLVPVDAAGTVRAEAVESVDCDRLGICFGFLAASELARQAGATPRWSAAGGGWLVDHDNWMRTGVTGLFVAGELTGVAGADVSMLEGRLAGLGIARELNRIDGQRAERLARATRSRLSGALRFAELLRGLAYPGKRLLRQLMTDSSLLCKCEEVSVADFKHCLTGHPFIDDANGAKLISRVGMGLCQGRYCHYHLCGLVADAAGVDEQEVRAFTARFPAKPVTIKALLNRGDD